VHALIEGVRPARIILFGSRARGDARPDSDYDLVVELEFDDFRECHGRVYDAVHEARTRGPFDILIRRPGQIEQQRDDPGYMDWDIARDGVVIYPAGSNSETLRPTRPRLGVVRESFEQYGSVAAWLERADEDLRSIENNLAAGENASWSGVCFHGQQLAEKYLKVLFIQRHVRPPRTHDLDELIAELRELGYELRDFTAECRLLEPYAVAVRYPERMPIPDETSGRAVLGAARAIAGAAKALLTFI
jgi:HEPN domain-containing protein